MPDKGRCQWRDPLGVLLAKFMTSPASASVSPETLKLALKLAHHQPGDTVALTWHPEANSDPIPVSLSALAVLAFTAQLPDAVNQQDSFYAISFSNGLSHPRLVAVRCHRPAAGSPSQPQ